ncbi:MAG TPA: hypothetical protein VFI23_14245 [Rhizomicrobium sp.]|nr:hypothetical protein [Rhizomicrobium sp.]
MVPSSAIIIRLTKETGASAFRAPLAPQQRCGFFRHAEPLDRTKKKMTFINLATQERASVVNALYRIRACADQIALIAPNMPATEVGPDIALKSIKG